ncbi:MAG: erythromycin esterase family protein [Chloroflexi bacterium]|nr:erythromycin esterase family protein [Chloroflexota bacterium]
MGLFGRSDRSNDEDLARAIREASEPLTEDGDGYDSLVERAGPRRLVLIGEASHGTHEFYVGRARITRRLIAEHGFTGVAVEADWPDAYRVNCYVQGRGADYSAPEALGDFRRFPTWMWRNTAVVDFVEWLRSRNATLPNERPKVGFYGMDLYSLGASMEAVVRYLDRVDPEAARRARARYACFEEFHAEGQSYGYAAVSGRAEPCEDEVVEQLVELQRRAGDYARRDGRVAEDEYFYAEQNARLAKNAEEYYRSMFRGRVSSWNLRDCHMAETLDNLMAHLRRQGVEPKLVVWAHNSHLGDARATEMGHGGELNVGQLARERHGSDAFLIGLTTYTGSVTAASDWDAPTERKRVRPGLPGSYEALFHEVGLRRFALMLRGGGDVAAALQRPRLERAIGVIYRPETERLSHYFDAHLADQFDAVLHFDETRALEPLERWSYEERSEVPETFPSAL